MEIIFMNSGNSKIYDLHRVLLNLLDEINLKRVIHVLLYQILAFAIHWNIWKTYKNDKFKISAPTWNTEFELPDGSYSVSDIQHCFEYIFERSWSRCW